MFQYITSMLFIYFFSYFNITLRMLSKYTILNNCYS